MIKSMTFRAFFVIATFFNLKINQMNVKIVFLYEFIDAKMYVKYSKEYDEKRICKLNKTLYDLKQSSRLLYEKLSNFLFEKLSLKHLNVDHNIFVIDHDFQDLIFIT